MKIKIPGLVGGMAILASLLLSTAAFADQLPGSVYSDQTDPVFDLYEGIANHLTLNGNPFLVIGGDVILCEPGSGACGAGNTANWSDVVVFGPDLITSTATIYSNDNGSLATLLAGGFAPAFNSAYIQEDPSGDTYYNPFFIQGGQGIEVAYNIHTGGADPGGVPEPSSTLTMIGLAGIVGLAGIRRRARVI